ncbi:MAG: efflux RND transporter periplasmic adaptor subunit [Patescibacteria group bacterium]
MKLVNSILLPAKNLTSKRFEQFKKLSLRKKIIYTVIAIIFFIVIFQIFKTITKKPSYTTAKVEKTDITETVSETGNIITGGKIDVVSPTNGIVEEIYVSNGNEVIEGQSLFTVKSSTTEQEQQASYANYLTAQATQNSAESNLNVLRATMYSYWDTFRDLATGDAYETGDNKPRDTERLESPEFQIAQDNWHAAEKKYKDQQTVVAQGKAQVGSTWLLYQATQNALVKAPISGTISNLSANIGKAVKASTITSTALPVLSIANFTTTEVQISLSETDISKVKPTQKAKIEINAINNKIYDGIVSRVDDIGTEIQGVTRYNVYLEITNPDEKLRYGMNSDATITTNKLEDTLSVPNSAIKPYQGGRAVRIPEGKDKVKFVPVVIGVRGTTRTQILKGIAEGQEIITTLSNEQVKRPGLFGN